jgi:hypothetical protein
LLLYEIVGRPKTARNNLVIGFSIVSIC